MSPLGRDIICYLGNTTVEERYEQHSLFCLIVVPLPGGWSFYTFVSGVQDHTPGRGYSCYITCYLGNITVEERYEQHSYMLPR